LQSAVIKANGEARSAELIGESLRKNKGFLELRRLEAAREIAAILSQSQNKVMLDSDTLLLNREQLQLTYKRKLIFFSGDYS
jgi:prohibitin 2